MVTDVVSVGLPVVFVLGVMEGVKGYRRSGRQVLHQHLDLLVDQSTSGEDGEERGDSLRHGR